MGAWNQPLEIPPVIPVVDFRDLQRKRFTLWQYDAQFTETDRVTCPLFILEQSNAGSLVQFTVLTETSSLVHAIHGCSGIEQIRIDDSFEPRKSRTNPVTNFRWKFCPEGAIRLNFTVVCLLHESDGLRSCCSKRGIEQRLETFIVSKRITGNFDATDMLGEQRFMCDLGNVSNAVHRGTKTYRVEQLSCGLTVGELLTSRQALRSFRLRLLTMLPTTSSGSLL